VLDGSFSALLSHVQTSISEQLMPTAETILVADTEYGEISYFGFDAPIGDALRLYGGWATTEIRFLRQFIAPGDTVVDGGANVGTHTMGFADACGPKGSVVAIEASPEIAALLKRNVERNELHQVRVISAAVGAMAGACIVDRVDPGKPQNTGMLQPVPIDALDGRGLRTPMITLDSLNLQQLSLLKLDIEGGEMAALQGGLETVKRLRPIIMIELLSLSASLPIMNMLIDLEYKPFFCSFAAFDSSNYRGETENIFGVARECGLLFVPDASLVPISTAGSYISAVTNVDELARLITEMPRYGDRTDHDRISRLVAEERDRAEAALARIPSTGAEVEPASMEEIRHIWRSLEELKAKWEQVADNANTSLSELRADFDTAPRTNFGETRAEIDLAIAQVKAEVTAIRASLLDSGESRGKTVLALEAMNCQIASMTADIAELKAWSLRSIIRTFTRSIARSVGLERK
jgi:FkbM family methyltransferase